MNFKSITEEWQEKISYSHFLLHLERVSYTSKMMLTKVAPATVPSNRHQNVPILPKDPRNSPWQLAWMTNLSIASVHGNLIKDPKLRKINASWILHLLNDEH